MFGDVEHGRAGLAGEMRDVDPRKRIIGQQTHLVSTRHGFKGPTQSQGRHGATMAACVYEQLNAHIRAQHNPMANAGRIDKLGFITTAATLCRG